MKVLWSVLIFTAALTLGTKVIAEEGRVSHDKTAEKTQKEERAEGHGSEKLFPPPQPEPENAKIPGKVELVEPTYFSTVSGQTTLKWKAVADAQNYHLQVATDPNFKWLKVDEQMYKDTSFQVTGLDAGVHYYWRVAAKNEDKWRGSSTGYFSTSMFETK